jgi:hypothetical protein
LREAVERSGFAIAEEVLDRAEVERLIAAVADIPRRRAGARNALREPAVHALAHDPRLADLAADVLGTAAIPFRATLFDKTRLASWLVAWHQDTVLPLRHRHSEAGWGPWSTKGVVLNANAPASALERVVALRVHLDDSTHANGPLRVLPGSHALGVLSCAAIEDIKASRLPVACTVGPGGILILRPLLVHASSKSETDRPRRVIHIEYAASLTIVEGVELGMV